MASSSSGNSQHDVFISFRGADVRYKFLSHVLAALERKQIKAFVDDTDLKKGKQITPTLLKAIEVSYISTVIFSKDYPNSEWCLDELEKILDCKEKEGQTVVPVFYDVDPSVVRDLKEDYALTIHAGIAQDLKLENWRKALKKISNLSGFNSADPKHKPESKLCDEIADDISKKLSGLSASYSLGYGLFDFDSRIKDVVSLTEKEKHSISMVGIWGMGGIGKTTLADKVFNTIKEDFGGHCFIWNVKDELRKKRAPDKLRDEIVRELLGDEERRLKIGTPHTIDDSIRRRLKDKKLLIVLDDVEDGMQLKSLLEDSGLYSPGMFCPGSRIVVTSRDKQVLESVHMKNYIYEVKQLNDYQALQLFSWRAFRQSSPQEEYKKLSKKVVKYAQGLPLALVVLGSELKGKRIDQWEATLRKYSNIPHMNVQIILRISFDRLDRDEKSIFLDIACFLKGEEKEYVEGILKYCGFHSRNGIDRLCDKSLISINGESGTIEMHDLIQQMGQEIVVEESRNMPEKQSRLWNCEDIKYVLESDRGTKNVEGISLSVGEIDGCLNISSKAFINMHKLRFLRIFGGFDYLYFVENKVFLPEGLKFLPNSLRYLYWEEFPLSSLPSESSLEMLVELNLSYSKLEELDWDKPPRNLKRICLNFSYDLIKIPDLAEAPNLRVIELRGCKRLTEIGSSLEKLNNLIKLDLRNTTYLYKLPEIPSSIRELNLTPTSSYIPQVLEIIGFPNLTSLPNTICNLRSLKRLRISHCKNLMTLPENLGNFVSLEKLIVCYSGLRELRSSICNLRSLNSLDISYCKNLKKLPEDFGNLESLEEFVASGSGLKELSFSTCNLRSLEILWILECRSLNKLPKDLGNLDFLKVLNVSRNCLKELPSSICKLRYLKRLNISQCLHLNKLPENFGNLESLEEFDANRSGLEELPSSIKHLGKLRLLDLRYCMKLGSLPDIPQNLEQLRAANCKSLESVCPSFEFPHGFLDFSNSDNLNVGASSTIQKRLQELQYVSTYKCTDLCILGSEVPRWMKYRNSSGSSLSFEFDTHGRSIPFIFCAVIVAVDHHPSYLMLKACLRDKWGNMRIHFSNKAHMIEIDNNLEHVILWHGQVDLNVASFDVIRHRGEDCLIIKSIGVHPVVKSGDEEDGRPWTSNLLSLE